MSPSRSARSPVTTAPRSRCGSTAGATDLAGLPRTFIDVGSNDIFRDEDIAYATRLWSAGVPTEVHVYPGGPHGYESLAGETELAERTMAGRYAFLKSV